MKRLLCALFVAATLATAQAEQAAARFASADEAVAALTAAVKAEGLDSLVALLGPGAKKVLTSGDPQEDAHARQRFLNDLEQKVELVKERGATFLYVGNEAWAFPIPLKESGGHWAFDLKAGEKDLLARRVGHNELNAMEVMHTVATAEREYATRDWNGNRVLEFARKIMSSPGHQDGLYWVNKPGGLMSPLGALVATAQQEGYSVKRAHPYHGYFYRILTRQGAHAPGGAHNYIINGNMIAGFAVLAWPATWGNSGIQTFMLGPNGEMFQRNLGRDTSEIVKTIDSFDPGPGWTLVKEDR